MCRTLDIVRGLIREWFRTNEGEWDYDALESNFGFILNILKTDSNGSVITSTIFKNSLKLFD